MFYIRADGNSIIGMGHVMRCLSIADAMKEQAIEPTFITACRECIPVIEQRGYQTKVLTTDYREMLSELPQLASIFEQEENTRHFVLVDSYQVSERYFEELHKFADTACLEDMGKPYPTDILINYNIYGEKLASCYRLEKQNCPKQMLLGPAYTPLRQEFLKDISYSLNNSVTDVMITTGGSDPLFASKAFIDAFLANTELQQKNIKYHVISGPFNSHASELQEIYKNKENIVIHEHVKSMKEIMRQCDLILTATGSTIYEVCALGVPMMVFYFVENQRQGAEEISKKTHVINCGDFSAEPKNVVDKAVDTLLYCTQEQSYRNLLYQEEKQLVDGRGAYRIAKEILKFL